MALRCKDCGESVDPRDDRTILEVVGFSKRVPQYEGQKVVYAETTGRFLCGNCVLRRRYAEPVQLSFDGKSDVPWEDAAKR